MTSPRDNDELYSERELAEIDELNRLTHSPSFFQSPWWRRGAIAASLLIVLSLLVPVALQLRGPGGSEEPSAATALPVPDFALEAARGGTVRLSDELSANSAVVIVFYRGYF